MSVRSAMSAVLGGSREIGPIGTASRIVVGLVAVGLPVVLSGIGWWDIVAALVVLPLVTTVVAVVVTAVYERFAPKALARRHAICSGPACWLIAVMVGVTVFDASRRGAGLRRLRGARDSQPDHRPQRPDRLHRLHTDRQGRIEAQNG